MTPLNKHLTGAKMSKRTLSALNESIEHWRRAESGNLAHGEGIGPKHCALCKLFKRKLTCAGCPVATKTGYPFCVYTPYTGASIAWLHYGFSSKHFRAAASKERAFLESLLPQPE